MYGLAIGRAMFGESMFSKKPNASKIALLFLDGLLADGTFGILDCQVQSSHLMSLGATLMSRADFTKSLDELCEPTKPFAGWPETPLPVTQLVENRD